jgi:hypothetical protein
MPRADGRPPDKLSPRVKLAARLFATGAVPTKKEAAEAAGLNPTYFSVISSPDHSRYIPLVGTLMEDIDKAMHDKSIQTSALLELIGREALIEMRDMMKTSQNAAIKFKATQDLLDRSPDTSKIHKHQVAGFSIAGEDAKQIAAALVQSAHVRAMVGDAVLGDFVRIPVDPTYEEDYSDAGQGLQPPEVRQIHQGQQLSAEGCGPVSSGPAGDLQQGQPAPGSTPKDAAA